MDDDSWEPDQRDPHERFAVSDPWDHPGWPLVSRIVAAATDSEPTLPQHGDGVDDAVAGLLADDAWRRDVALADAMGLVGDWGTEDVHDAVTQAAHRYRRGEPRVEPAAEQEAARQRRRREDLAEFFAVLDEPPFAPELADAPLVTGESGAPAPLVVDQPVHDSTLPAELEHSTPTDSRVLVEFDSGPLHEADLLVQPDRRGELPTVVVTDEGDFWMAYVLVDTDGRTRRYRYAGSATDREIQRCPHISGNDLPDSERP